MARTDENEQTIDRLCNEKLIISQQKRLYRFSVDSILLANFVVLKKGERLLDVGSGCGIIPIYISKRGYRNSMVGVEIQKELFDLSLINKRLNNITTEISFIHGDIKKLTGTLLKNRFDVIVSNPPYTRKGTGRASPGKSRLLARYEHSLDLPEFIRAAATLLGTKGRLYVIYPVRRFGELVTTAAARKLELKRLRPVYPYADQEANLFLAEFIKEAGTGVKFEKPLYIYDNGHLAEEVAGYYTLDGDDI